MEHLTLNTGHCRTSPRSEVSDAVVVAMRCLLSPGVHELGRLAEDLVGYQLQVPACDHGYVATVHFGDAPLAAIGVADSPEAAAETWAALTQVHAAIGSTDPPPQPTSLPWCAVVLLLPIVTDWLGDFERCLAWAWLERRTDVTGG